MKIVASSLLLSLFALTVNASSCVEILNKYNEYSDLSNNAINKHEKAKYEKIAIDYLKKVIPACQHLPKEERAEIKKTIAKYNKK